MSRPTKTFAAYASNFINQSVLAQSQSTDSDTQPLFFSFTDAGASRIANERAAELDEEPLELDDERDDRGLPVLHGGYSYDSRNELSIYPADDDPYLRLDDNDDSPVAGPSSSSYPILPSQTFEDSTESLIPESGELLPTHYKPPKPPSLSDSESDSASQSSSPPRSPPPDLLEEPLDRIPLSPTPPPPRTLTGLTDSLLPRDGQTRSIFSLPEPSRVPRHKYKDPMWTVIYCSAVSACFIGLILTLILTHSPAEKTPSPVPYSTLLHAVPFLTLMAVISTFCAYLLLLALQFAVHPVLLVVSVFIPFLLVVSAIWAFSGSFIWDGREGTWGETVGLRIYAIVPLLFAFLFARSIHNQRHSMLQTSRVTELSIRILRDHAPLLVLSPALLLAVMLASLPFLSLIFRLFLIGKFTPGSDGGLIWHLHTYAGWLIAGALVTWIWTWFIARGMMRMICSSVVGAWYFKRKQYPDPTLTTKAALGRAAGPSLGTVCFAALVLSVVQSLILILRLARRLTSLSFMPLFLHPLALPISIAQSSLSSVSQFALVYSGLTGDSFVQAAKRSKAVTSIKRPGIARRHYSLLSTLLLMLSLAFGACAALAAFLFTAHSLQRPYHAPLSAFLAGTIGCLVVWFSTSLVSDTADTLYTCYCLDREAGAQHSRDTFYAFEGRRTVPAGV